MTSNSHGLHQEEHCGSHHGNGDDPEGDGNRIIRVQEAVALEDCIVVFDWSVSHLACQKNEKQMWDRNCRWWFEPRVWWSISHTSTIFCASMSTQYQLFNLSLLSRLGTLQGAISFFYRSHPDMDNFHIENQFRATTSTIAAVAVVVDNGCSSNI